MTKPLIELLRERCAFDESLTYKLADGHNLDYYFSEHDWSLSAQLENARLQPILQALAEVVSAAEFAFDHAREHCDGECIRESCGAALERLKGVVESTQK